MTSDLPPIKLRGKQLRKYHHIRRRYPVTRAFLKSNIHNVKRFIIYALTPHCVLRRYAWRKKNRIFIVNRVRHLLFDPRMKGMIKRRKRNVRQWSQRVVEFYKCMGHIEEYEETEVYDVQPQPPVGTLGAEELSKQMKEQLELLKSGKRGLVLIEKKAEVEDEVMMVEKSKDRPSIEREEEAEEKIKEIEEEKIAEPIILDQEMEKELSDEEKLPKDKEEKVPEPTTETKTPEKEPEKPSGGSKFLDMLISKVRVKNFAKESNIPSTMESQSLPTKEAEPASPSTLTSTPTKELNSAADDSTEDFLGFDFDETGHQPGMLLTPLVPQSCQTGNSAFVSDSLEAYMRKNNIRETPITPRSAKSPTEKIFGPKMLDGLVTADSQAPHMDMPLLPEGMQKLRTVAERRQYLNRISRFSKNHKLAIANNEANIYRELQRKQRNQKAKACSLQSLNSYMPFTREGWRAASYVATENERYYYQVIKVDGEEVKLPGSMGNNLSRNKKAYKSKLSESEMSSMQCDNSCLDAVIARELKVIKTKEQKTKLNQFPLPAVFRPCPLSQKPYQKPIDDDTAALLLAGGSMAVVSMPTVTLEVEPQLGCQLDEIAKRYLQYILPHHDITREWAEFSVSTLQQPSTMRDAEAEAAKTLAGRRKSFTFVIPYLNDRNHILVRRVVDRSEPLDATFIEGSPSKLLEFEFRKDLPQLAEDNDQLVCADMIGEMINTVAISCSENSFICADPDGRVHHSHESQIKAEDAEIEDSIAKPTKVGKSNSKQRRLRSELKRLNATIIEAAKSEITNKPCTKLPCQMGCVCESLTGELPLREHCGRADCVLDCTCQGAERTRVMRVQTDGCGISNEDAFNLRRQATARLAKMEKEFTSTLVLTENETLLINESQCDKKRRSTKAPKRFEDFADLTEDERSAPPAPKRELPRRRVVNIESTSAHANNSQSTQFVGALSEPCSVKDTDLAQLKHCTVSLRRLPDMSNLATFCMTHQLYKCFCGGDSLEGKPVVIEKYIPNTTTQHFVTEVVSRARYSFERPEAPTIDENPKRKVARKSKEAQPKMTMTVKQVTTPPPVEVKVELGLPEDVTSPSSLAPAVAAAPAHVPFERPAELDIIYGFFKSRPHLPRRLVPVPRNCYLRLNRRRAHLVMEKMAREENAMTKIQLKNRVFNAIRSYRIELNQQQKGHVRRFLDNDLSSSPVIEVRDDSDEELPEPKAPEIVKKKRNSQSSGLPDLNPKRIKLVNEPISPTSEDIPAITLMDTPSSSSATSMTSDMDIQVPKIAACYSLNAASISGNTSAEVKSATDVLNPEIVQELSVGHNGKDANFRNFYNEVVKNMNALVSKKMQDIDMALQRESKIIPAPNEEILCIIKWTNFLAAFECNYVFIWDVKMKNYSFLAATTTNQMPTVCGALGVISILAMERKSLPLMAQMLLESKRNENTSRLAVVMQGRLQYWLVKGFLRHKAGNACTKPTPSTHPLLTKKINILCSLLVKQRLREHQRKQQQEVQQLEAPVQQHQQQEARVQQQPEVRVQKPQVAPPVARSLSLPSRSVQSNNAAMRSTGASTVGVSASAPSAKPNKDHSQNIRSNIDFRKVSRQDVDELQLPEVHTGDHRWVVLDLFDDFSHIFVPAFKDMISLDRVHNVMDVAKEKNKVVKLQFFKNSPYDAFVTPESRRKIYFGPLRLDMPPPVLVLLQSVDGKMMLREVYQREHSIPVKRDKRTMAFWVLHINGQVHFEVEMNGESKVSDKTLPTIPANINIVKLTPLKALESSQKSQPAKDDDDDDDDCVIIEDDSDEERVPQAPNMLTIKQEPPQEKRQRLNFTIQTAPTDGSLLITKKDKADGSSLSVLPQNITAAGGFVPFVAKIAANSSPSSQPHFITPHVQLTQTPALPPNNLNEVAHPPPAKVSRISGTTPNRVNESLQKLLGPNNNMKPVSMTSTTGMSGITITKIPVPRKSPPSSDILKTVLIGGGSAGSAVKRTTSGVRKILPKSIVAAKKPTTPTSINSSINSVGPTIIKQSPTTISISNLPPHLTNGPRTVKLPTSIVQRQSLPAKLPTQIINNNNNLKGSPKVNAKAINNTNSGVEKQRRSEPVPALPMKKNEDVVYGYMVAKGVAMDRLPRFRVKKVNTEYMVKIPDVGVLRLKSSTEVEVFLNKILSRNMDYQSFLPVEWSLVPNDVLVRPTTAAPSSAPKTTTVSSSETAILIED